MKYCVLVHIIKRYMINVYNKHSKSFYRCENVSECRKNTVKQTKYVNEVTNSENRIKTKWKFCTKKTSYFHELYGKSNKTNIYNNHKKRCLLQLQYIIFIYITCLSI